MTPGASWPGTPSRSSAVQRGHGNGVPAPSLVVPPPIGRFYFLDLRPGRSFVEYAASHGLQTHAQLAEPEGRAWPVGPGHLRPTILAAIDTVRVVTGSPDVNLIGFCAGGIIATTLLNHLAARGDDRVHSMSYAVTLLDFGLRAPITAFSGRGLIAFAGSRSRRKGIITSRQMGAVHGAPRRPRLQLLGEQLPDGREAEAFDILAWNADGTNLPGALHGQFLDIFRETFWSAPESQRSGHSGAAWRPSPCRPSDRSGRRSPDAMEGLLPHHAATRRAVHLRAQLPGHIASLVNPPGNQGDTGPAARTC